MLIFTIIIPIAMLIIAILTLYFDENAQDFIKNIFKKQEYTYRYFKPIIPTTKSVDYLFFPLGLRANIPVTDWFYFEFIKKINKEIIDKDKNNKIKKLVICLAIDYDEEKARKCYMAFKNNIEKLFKDSTIDVECILPYDDNYFRVNPS